MEIYDELLGRWPIPYEELDLDTSYGTVHVIASGPEDGEPVLLLHASEMSATSWAWNIEALSNYRTYAIDHIGEVNKSRLASTSSYPKTREEISSLYAEIADLLGIDQAILVAGSNGGFIAMTFAIHHPDRVSRLILTGPMGLTAPKAQMGLRLLAAQFIHLKAVEQRTLDWVLGESPSVRDPYGEWFSLVMSGSFPCVVPPSGIPSEELATIQIPVLLFLGTTDNLVGDAANAADAASVMPNVEVRIVESSHLVNVEAADEVNAGIAEFLGN
jgi:pimeloyl-ACP methyl ester carboxylesterase